MPPTVWTIVVAAGSGSRFGGRKQFADLDGTTVLGWSQAAAASVSDGVVTVVPPGDALGPGEVHGGATRSESVRAGLAAVPAGAEVVLVHDAARPFASPALFAAVIHAVQTGADGAVPGVPVTDTVKVVAGDVVVATPERSTLVAVQTPQGFRCEVLRRAHAAGGDATDDAALVEQAGGRVVVVPGEPENRKVTRPEDLAWARARVAAGEVAFPGARA